ncbi:MAG: hypothetical protein KJ556_20765 [Gammaproteobacteria bacterium]|nr:hypothetical protein [Gammaproteobacteria bacterium]
MSYTTLYSISKDGNVYSFREFRNAFRSAYLVWDNMAKRYLGKEASSFMIGNNMQQVWDLWTKEDIPEAHRLTMAATFDHVIVRRENFETLANAFDQYAKDFADPGHIPAQANALRELATTDCLGACWQQTSVAEDLWQIWNYEEDEGRPYNINVDEGHWFLFDCLDA